MECHLSVLDQQYITCVFRIESNRWQGELHARVCGKFTKTTPDQKKLFLHFDKTFQLRMAQCDGAHKARHKKTFPGWNFVHMKFQCGIVFEFLGRLLKLERSGIVELAPQFLAKKRADH